MWPLRGSHRTDCSPETNHGLSSTGVWLSPTFTWPAWVEMGLVWPELAVPHCLSQLRQVHLEQAA